MNVNQGIRVSLGLCFSFSFYQFHFSPLIIHTFCEYIFHVYLSHQSLVSLYCPRRGPAIQTRRDFNQRKQLSFSAEAYAYSRIPLLPLDHKLLLKDLLVWAHFDIRRKLLQLLQHYITIRTL